MTRTEYHYSFQTHLILKFSLIPVFIDDLLLIIFHIICFIKFLSVDECIHNRIFNSFNYNRNLSHKLNFLFTKLLIFLDTYNFISYFYVKCLFIEVILFKCYSWNILLMISLLVNDGPKTNLLSLFQIMGQ